MWLHIFSLAEEILNPAKSKELGKLCSSHVKKISQLSVNELAYNWAKKKLNSSLPG